MAKFPLLILFFFLYHNVCYAQKVIKIENNPYQNLGQKIGFKEDKTGVMTFEEIVALPDSVFRLGKSEIFNGSSAGKTWWMKLKYTSAPDIRPYLVFDYGNIDHIDIYYKDHMNNIKHIHSGTFSSSASRAFISTEYIFQLPDVGGDVKEVYVRLKAANTLLVPVKLIDGITLARALINKYIWQLLYVGIAFSLFLFNLFMLFSSRDKRYGLYMIRIFCLFYIYVLAYLNGYAHFFSDQASKFILIHAHAFAAIGFIATVWFNNSFLNLKAHMPKSYKWFNVLIVLWLAMFILSFWDSRSITNRIAQALIFISSVSIIYTSIKALRKKSSYKKDRYLVFYLIGWFPICLSTVYVVLTLIDVLPLKDYTFKVLNAAGITEAILISLALLGDRISMLRKGKEKAEQDSITLIRERNVYLEQKIEERTKELQLVNAKLQESSDFKDKLFSIIAHDMRSPLSSLKLALQMVDRDMLNADNLSSILTGIRKNTEQVQQTMDNLLNWSISQMKLQVYQPESIHIYHFLQEHVTLYETLAQQKGILTQLNCPEGLNVIADKNQLSLIFRNLIDNAIKFTPTNGNIEVGLKLQQNNGILYVSNSGKLISNETIAKILGNNQNTLNTSYGTAQEKGTGLGLQLCKEFLKNLNSELSIESSTKNETEITIFSFKISLDKDAF